MAIEYQIILIFNGLMGFNQKKLIENKIGGGVGVFFLGAFSLWEGGGILPQISYKPSRDL